MLLLPPRTVALLAGRIEGAYLRRFPRLRREYAQSPVWNSAAARLVELHRGDPTYPLDPELFVAVQDGSRVGADPWKDLARPEAVRRYRRRIDRIVRRLGQELRAEVRRAERLLHAGRPLGELLASLSDRFSPLGRYAVAYRAGRPDLAELFIAAARQQHRGCPLYRQACGGLIPAEAYPIFDPTAEWSLVCGEDAEGPVPAWRLN